MNRKIDEKMLVDLIRYTDLMINCSSSYSSFCHYLSYHHALIFVKYCGSSSNACVVNHCSGATRPQVAFCAHFLFPKMFMPSLNGTSVSVPFSQTSFSEAWMMGFVLPCKVSSLLYTRHSDFVTWAEKFSASSLDCNISTKQPQKLPHSLCNSSQYTLLSYKTWF